MINEEGPGWRLARDTLRRNFPVLIGGDNWAIELTANEWDSLVPLIGDLVEQHKQLEKQLMPQESIALELERKPWWACLDGDKDSWSLKLILEYEENPLRGVEVQWPTPASKAIATAMRTMWDSYQ